MNYVEFALRMSYMDVSVEFETTRRGKTFKVGKEVLDL